MKYNNIIDILEFLSKYNIKIELNDSFKKLKKNLPKNFKHKNYLKINNLNINSSRFNLNLLCKIEGIVNINDKEIETFIYRNIPIVKDGITINKNLKFIIDDETKKFFINFIKYNENISPTMINILLNIINEKEVSLKYIQPIDFNNFKNSGDVLLKKYKEVIELEAEVKALKNFVLDYKENSIPDELAKYFNRDGSLKEPYVKREKEEIKLKLPIIKSNVKIPSLNSVLKKVKEDKKLNSSDKLLLKKYKHYEKIVKNGGVTIENDYYEKSNRLKLLKNEIILGLISNKIFSINNIKDKKLTDKIDDIDIDLSIIDSKDDIAANIEYQYLLKFGIKDKEYSDLIKYVLNNREQFNDKDIFELIKIAKKNNKIEINNNEIIIDI